MKIKTITVRLLLSILAFQFSVFGQGTAFTYQGHLTASGSPSHGSHDLTFSVWSDPAGPAQVGPTLTNAATTVSNGLFTVTLDFGAGLFAGADRWLEIGVRTNGGTSFTLLSPRQKITPTPYAIHAADAGSAAVASSVANGAVTTAAIAAGAVTADKLATNSIGPAQLSHRYLSGAVAYSTLPGSFQFSTILVDQAVGFATAFSSTPVITLTIDTAHPALPGKGPLLITTRNSSGFTVRVPTAAVGVEIGRTGLSQNRPTIRTVNGNPAVLGTCQLGFNIGLTYSRSADAVGGNWPSPVILAPGYISASTLDVAAGQPAATYLDALGGVSFLRANDTNGTSWPTATQILTPAALGGMAQGFSGALVNGNPALVVAGQTTNVYYLRADDDKGSSWGTPATVFTASNYVNSVALAMVGGRPAFAVVANQRIYFARANDANGTSWPAAVVAVLPDLASDIPLGNLSLLDIAGTPAIGFVAQAGQYSANKTLFFVQSTDTSGTGWSPPAYVPTPTPNLMSSAFNLIGSTPAFSYTQDGLLYFGKSFASGPSFIFPSPVGIEPALDACSLELVNGQPAIAFYGNGSLRFIRQGTPPPNSAINWIAVEP